MAETYAYRFLYAIIYDNNKYIFFPINAVIVIRLTLVKIRCHIRVLSQTKNADTAKHNPMMLAILDNKQQLNGISHTPKVR